MTIRLPILNAWLAGIIRTPSPGLKITMDIGSIGTNELVNPCANDFLSHKKIPFQSSVQ